jgi:tetratricopeptide (TPR) repeat protein
MASTVRTIASCLCSLALVFSLSKVSQAQSRSSQEILTQDISDLRRNPNEHALRAKIINHVQNTNPKPVVPEEAKRHLVRGKAAFKDAKDARDFNEAAEEFKQALLVAPWLVEAYFNLGIIQDKAGQYAAAIENLKLYVGAAPNAPDVGKVQELIYEIEYREEKRLKESERTAVGQRARAGPSSLSGTWTGYFLNTGLYVRPTVSSDWLRSGVNVDVVVSEQTFEAILRSKSGESQYVYKGAIHGNRITGIFTDSDPSTMASCGMTAPPSSLDGELSSDGSRILLVVRGAQLLKGGGCKYDAERYSKSMLLGR